MHQTTCGATHRVKIFNHKNIKRFLEEQEEIFNQCMESNACMYPNKKVLNSSSINYLNIHEDASFKIPDFQLKLMLRKEFDECEQLYPFGGQVFLNLFFNKKILNSKSLKVINRENYSYFLETLTDINAYNITKWLFENSSTERTIDILESYTKDIHIKKENDIFFKTEYDTDFLGGKSVLEMKDYRFAIIDGYIESVSEIHHMLHYASTSKEPYVFFCFGMSEEVKNVIIQNNTRKITQIFPVSMKIKEDTANILNDIALLHNSDIITSLKGQTISQAISKGLSQGDMIIFDRKGFKVQPTCSRAQIRSHIRFLEKRIKNSSADMNTDLVKDRIKILRSKALNIYLPEELKNDVTFNIEIDYAMRAINYNQAAYYAVDMDMRKIMIPKMFYDHIDKKVNTTKKMFYNIDKMLILQE